MAKGWLESLDVDTRARARALIAELKRLGAPDPEGLVRADLEENLPQVASFLLLRGLRKDLDAWRDGAREYVSRLIGAAELRPEGPFADAGRALKRMAGAGIPVEEIGAFARWVAHETTSSVLGRLDDGLEPEGGEGLPGWALLELDEEGEVTGRAIEGLQEELAGDAGPAEEDEDP